MKSYIIPAILSIIILTGCSSTKSTADYDDVYYSTRTEKKAAKQKSKELNSAQPDYYTQNDNVTTDYYVEDYETGENVTYEEEPTYVESETMQGPDGATNITNNYYGSSGYDDYYDYSYSSRINRFYNPYAGFGYYSPYYAGFYYDPYWYMPSFYFSMSWGWGGYGCGYPYYPYNNYGYGYNQGYNNGYWDGYYANNYYNDGGSYYGPRTSGYSSNGTSSSQRGEANNISRGNIENVYSAPIASRIGNVSNETGGSRNSTAVATSSQKRPSTNNTSTASSENAQSGNRGSSVNTSVLGAASISAQEVKTRNNKPTSEKARYTYKKPANSNSKKTVYSPGEKLNTSANSVQRNVSQKYQKPASSRNENSVNSKRTNTASKNTQVYSRPKSNSNKSYTQPTKYNSNRSNTNSSQSAKKTYSQPSRTNTKSYSTPSRSTKSYSKPSSSGSSRSYSSPSRSSGSKSYSSPSRSSSSGGSRSSSSGGGSRSSSSGGRR